MDEPIIDIDAAIEEALLARLRSGLLMELSHMLDHVDQLHTLDSRDMCLALECLAQRAERFAFLSRSFKVIREIGNRT